MLTAAGAGVKFTVIDEFAGAVIQPLGSVYVYVSVLTPDPAVTGLNVAVVAFTGAKPVNVPKVPVPPVGLTFTFKVTAAPSLHTNVGFAAQLTVGNAFIVSGTCVIGPKQ
jgi:hypothetical protein